MERYGADCGNWKDRLTQWRQKCGESKRARAGQLCPSAHRAQIQALSP